MNIFKTVLYNILVQSKQYEIVLMPNSRTQYFALLYYVRRKLSLVERLLINETKSVLPSSYRFDIQLLINTLILFSDWILPNVL